MTYTTTAPTTSPFQGPAYRKPRKVQAKASSPYSNMEFQLVPHLTHGIVGRLYSPNRKINTTGSSRDIINNSGKVVIFKSTVEDYIMLSKACRPSNLAANKIRTNQIIQELQGYREPKWTATKVTAPVVTETKVSEPITPVTQVPEAVQSEEVTPLITPPPANTFIPLALPAAQPDAEEVHTVEIAETITIDLRATLNEYTAANLLKLVKKISTPYTGKRRKNQYINFLMANAEETIDLVA